jgi:sulfate/thiosulfate-binding protein
MNIKLKAAVVGLAGVLALTGCSAGGASGGGDRLSVVGFSVLETANEPVFDKFKETDAGKGVSFKTSYGASGDQTRAVEGGLEADYVHLSLEPDMTKLVEAGLVEETWKDTATKGIVSSSVVVLAVRPGNPKNIQGWDDLVQPGVEVVTPNPASSGGARWNILAAWAHATQGGDDDKAGEAFVGKLLKNTIALPGSAREALTAFTEGNGDVLISYENEAILSRQKGTELDYVVPEDTLLIENPAAVTEDAAPAAKDFLAFMTTDEAQSEYAKFGFRPVIDGIEADVEGANDPANPFPAPATLYTIDENFGGWAEAAPRFFDEESGIIPQLQAETGKTE